MGHRPFCIPTHPPGNRFRKTTKFPGVKPSTGDPRNEAESARGHASKAGCGRLGGFTYAFRPEARGPFGRGGACARRPSAGPKKLCSISSEI